MVVSNGVKERCVNTDKHQMDDMYEDGCLASVINRLPLGLPPDKL